MRRLTALIALPVLLAWSGSGTLSAKSTFSRRLGNNAEGVTAVSNGPGDTKVAVIDGYDVFIVPVGGNSKAPAHKLFDVKAQPWVSFPSGIAYLGLENNFVFVDQGNVDELVVTNSGGKLLPPRPIQYLPGTPLVFGTEGLLYLGADTAFPDTLARAAFFEDGNTGIEIMTRAGVVLREITVVGLPPEENYITGVIYVAPGQFLISIAGSHIWTVALDGTVVGGPVDLPETADIEGLVGFPDGRVFASDYTAGKLFALDANLARQPLADRSYAIGLGLSRGFDAIWDPLTSGLMINVLDRDHATPETAIVSPSLDSAQVLFQHPDTFGLALLPDGTIATCQIFGPARILHFTRTGVLLDQIDLTTMTPGLPPVRCGTIAYLSSIDAYAIRQRGVLRGQTVYLISRAGTFLRSFEIPEGLILSLAVPPDGSGDRLLVWTMPHLYTYDTAGALLSTQTLDTGPITVPFVGFTALPNGGYALLDPSNSEVAVF